MTVNGEQLAQALQQLSRLQQNLPTAERHSPTQGMAAQLAAISQFTNLPNNSRTGLDTQLTPLLRQIQQLSTTLNSGERQQTLNSDRTRTG